jgi:hypothetical protein
MRPEPVIGDALTLVRKRVHEAEGRGRRAFALFQAVRHPGPLVWILPSHVPEMPMLRGLPRGVGERLHLLRPAGETDLLWCVEEALRSNPLSLVATCRRIRAHDRSDAYLPGCGQQCHRNALELRSRGQRGCGLDSAQMVS